MDLGSVLKGSWDLATSYNYKVSIRVPLKGSIRDLGSVLKGSWDLATRAISKVTILITTYNPNQGTYNLTY